MSDVLSVLNLLGLGGLAAFIYWTYRGLQDRIKNLTKLAEEQRETLEAVRTRATELDQLRKDYRQGLDDFQHLGEKIKAKRDELEAEYQAAIQRKDQQIAQAKQLELKELELKEESLELIPKLQERLAETVSELQKQVATLTALAQPRTAQALRDERYFANLLIDGLLKWDSESPAQRHDVLAEVSRVLTKKTHN